MNRNLFSPSPLLFFGSGMLAAYYCFRPAALFFGGKAAVIFAASLPALLIFSAGVLLLTGGPRAGQGPTKAPASGGCGASRRERKPALLFILSFAAGLAAGLVAQGKASNQERLRTGFPRQEIGAVKGILTDDPQTSSGGRGMARLRLTESFGKKGSRAGAAGNVLVFFPEEAIPKVKDFGRGSEVYIEGKFAAGEGAGGKGGGLQAVFGAKAVYVVKAPPYMERLRTRCRLYLTEVFTGEDGSGGGGGKSRNGGNGRGALALALLLGIRDGLDGELAGQYRDAGCSYILALSGMHLAIVSSIIAFLLRRPLGLKASALLSALFIVLYVHLTGAQPSLVRAAIMYLAGTAALFLSLPKDPFKLLLLAFILQLVTDSASGRSVSFILSYLALAGILVFGADINAVLKGRLPPFLAGPLAASSGAFLATAQAGACFFGSVSVTGIIAGLVLVPLTTIFMVISIVCLALHFIHPALKAAPELLLTAFYEILRLTTKTAALVPPLRIKNTALFVPVSLALTFMLIYFCRRHLTRRGRFSPGRL